MGYRNYSTANGFIVDPSGNGDFKTIGAALTAAVSGDTIFIRPSTYTENITLKAGVNLCAYGPALNYYNASLATVPNVIIKGKCSYSSAGTVGIFGIALETNSDYALAVTGSAASVVLLEDCWMEGLNNTIIDFTSSSASAVINLVNVNGDLATTGIAYFTHSSAGSLSYTYCVFSNSGSSVTASTCSAGNIAFSYCTITSNITVSSTGTFQSYHTVFGSFNTTCLTFSATETHTLNWSNIGAGNAACISVGAGATLNVDYIDVSTTATNAITGSGTINYGIITYSNTGVANNVTTQTHFTTQPAVSSGVVVQQVRNTKSAAQTITNNIAADTTTPTTSTGSSVVQVSITPTNSSHILLIQAVLNVTSAGNFVSAYIIQNAAGNSIASSWVTVGAANQPTHVTLQAYITAGGTSAITFDLYGTTVGANTYVNANTSATQLSGGTCVSSLTVTEYTS